MEGYIKRTPQGRVATANAYRKLELKPPRRRASASCCSRRSPDPPVISERVEGSRGTVLPLKVGGDPSTRLMTVVRLMQSVTSRSLPVLRLTKILTVAELTRAIRGRSRRDSAQSGCRARSPNYKLHPSGPSVFHAQRFTCPDRVRDFARYMRRSLRQPLADGAQVQVYGTVTVFEARGQYQLSVEIVQPRGARFAAGEIRSAQTQAGSRRIVRSGAQESHCRNFRGASELSTSPSGAAIRDILNISAASRAVVANSDQSCSGAGDRRRHEIAVAINELCSPTHDLAAYRSDCHRARWRQHRGFVGV